MPNLTVGAFGKADSYSYLAANCVYGSKNLKSIPYAKDAFYELQQGRLDVAVVPMENISGGWVESVLYLLMKLHTNDPNSHITREIDMPIILCAAGKTDMPLNQAKKIYSHAYPLLHLSDWLRSKGAWGERIETTSTSEAAERASKDPYAVALCNGFAAKRYGLKVIDEPQGDNNITRFVSVSKVEKVRGVPSMTSLWFDVKEKVGSLVNVLEVFKNNNINLKRIESRSMDDFKSYRFFVELEGGDRQSRVKRALEQLKKRTLDMSVVGSYPVTKISRDKVSIIP